MKNIIDEIKKVAGDLSNTIQLKDIISSIGSDKLKAIQPEALALLVEAARFLSKDNDTGESYKPAENYADLLKQFNSLINLNRSLRQQVSFYRRNVGNEKANLKDISQLYEQVASERAANERLTEEVSNLNSKLLARDERIAALEAKQMAHNNGLAFPCQHGETVNGVLNRANEAEADLAQERENNMALRKEVERLGLVEHLMKSTARVLGHQHIDDPFVSQDVLSLTSSLLWNFEQLTRELTAGTQIPEPLNSARILPLPEGSLSKESVDLVARIAGQMLVHLSQAETQRGAGHQNDWMADNWQHDCISAINRHISKNNPIDAMNYIAFAAYHSWPINQQQ